MSTFGEPSDTLGGPTAHSDLASKLVLEDIRRRLNESPYAAMRCLNCEFHQGTLTLRGTVPTFYIRQVAHSLSLKVPGVVAVDDRITVDNAISPTNPIRR